MDCGEHMDAGRIYEFSNIILSCKNISKAVKECCGYVKTSASKKELIEYFKDFSKLEKEGKTISADYIECKE